MILFKNKFVWIGKWFYWREYPACSFTIERMALEKHIDRDTTNYTPAEPGLPRVLAKLKARQPVTIVTMGDSLSDKRHWANREKLWSEELVKKLKAAYGGEVTLVNPAIGGTTLSHNVILIPRWLSEAPTPDLVIIWFGGISFILVSVKEEILFHAFQSRLAQAQFRRRFVLVGGPEEAARVRAELKEKGHEASDVVAELNLSETPVPQLVELLHERSVNGVIINAKRAHFDEVEAVIRACELEGVEVWLMADFFKTQISRTSFDEVDRLPFL